MEYFKPEDFAADGVISGPCILTPWIAAERANRKVKSLQSQLAVAKEALEVIDHQDRLRGYPTGPEWMKLVKVAQAALDKIK